MSLEPRTDQGLSEGEQSALCIVRSMGFGKVFFNRGVQRLYTGTCIILQKAINGFLCLLIVFLYQVNLKDVIKLNRNLR